MFTRLIIRLRLPMAITAVLLTSVMIASIWLVASGSVFIAPLRTALGLEIAVDGIFASWGKVDWMLPSGGFKVQAAGSWNRWSWWPRLDRFGYSASVDFIAVPHWAVIAPTAALAFTGFRARRKQLARGHCRQCDYPREGSSICPECGRVAPLN
jgi:hypothetical protein